MLLQLRNVSSGYHRKRVLYDVSLSVERGEVVALIGHNGAGKTTTLRTILGLIRADAGEVLFEGQDVAGRPAVRNARAGIYLIPQERFTFPDLSVRENLMLGGHGVPDARLLAGTLDRVHGIFPILRERGGQRAGTLSGGQQRVLSMAMAMMAQPRLVLVDEPSLGLAPRVVEEVGETVARMARSGMGVLLVDQNIKQTLRISDRVYVMKNGHVVLEETGKRLLEQGQWWDLY